jgi:crotonobetainyl-CoA:carnitine CoA-transferase CaiB-like acyl-CoA transferase
VAGAPEVGQHTREVARMFLTEAQVDDLTARGVLFQADDAG